MHRNHFGIEFRGAPVFVRRFPPFLADCVDISQVEVGFGDLRIQRQHAPVRVLGFEPPSGLFAANPAVEPHVRVICAAPVGSQRPGAVPARPPRRRVAPSRCRSQRAIHGVATGTTPWKR